MNKRCGECHLPKKQKTATMRLSMLCGTTGPYGLLGSKENFRPS